MSDIGDWKEGEGGVRLLTTDNKRIGVLYLIVVTVLFLAGGLLGTLMRLELSTPQENLINAANYGRLFSMHGIIMVFFVLIPSIPAVFGSWLLPRLIGSRNLAFPGLAMISWILFAAGGLLALGSLAGGGVEAGWTFSALYTSAAGEGRINLVTFGVMLAFGSMVLLGINFISTIHTMRDSKVVWNRLPLMAWSLYITSWMILIAAPVLMASLLLLLAEQGLGIRVFDPAIGGEPALFKRLFWFFGRPALFIMILPAIGVMSELIGSHSRGKIFGYKGIAYSMVAIAVLSFLTSGGHLVGTPQSVETTVLSSLLNFLSAVPFLVILFSWGMTFFKGAVSVRAPVLYVLGSITLMVIGGLSGLFLAASGLSVHLHSTYFVLAHFHYLLAGAALMAFLGGLHFWWAELAGRSVPEILGRISAVLIFCGINLTFLPQFVLGFLGMPRRYSAYPIEFEVLQILATAGVPILALGYLGPMLYYGWALLRGARFEVRDSATVR